MMLNSLKKVCLSADVYSVCLGHALSNEKEEVMGLLIGKVDEELQISFISACRILARSDKQPDRVEISPEQLMEAATYAEQLSEKFGEPLRVLGWYHSHPHITVWPSHVDLRTQSMYQNMDKYFVGLIFSVFSTSRGSRGSLSNDINVTCFQTHIQKSNSTQYSRLEISLEILPTIQSSVSLQVLATLPQILSKEEEENIVISSTTQNSDELTILHNNALQTLQFVHITDKVSRPLIELLENYVKIKKKEVSILKNKIQKYAKE